MVKKITFSLNFHLYKNISVNISVLKTDLNRGTEGVAQCPQVTGQSFPQYEPLQLFSPFS